MKNKIIIANWKDNPATLVETEELFKAEIYIAKRYENVQTVICPPTEFLEQLLQGGPVNRAALYGAQDVFWPENSKPTVPISHVLVGHSERRYDLGETDEIVNQKLKAVLEEGIVPVLFVGERGGESREEILTVQLAKDLAGLSVEQVSKILFTYEPVWAISTNPGGHSDTPENALEAIKFIDDFLTIYYKLKTKNYLYGGSVNENNVADFLKHPEISGVVVGKASLDSNRFLQILNATTMIL